MTTIRKHFRRNAGFTLAEMLVVLAILAITTTIAVQSLVPVANEARYVSTQQTLTTIRTSIISTSTGTDGATSVSGLFADTGIFPFNGDTSLLQQVDNSGNSLFVSQPWGLNFASEVAFPVSTPGTYSIDTQLVAGWNGPYLRPAVGQTQIVDGWGRPLIFPTSFAADGSYTVASAGQDGVAGTTDDISTIIYATDYAATSLTVSLTEQVTSGAGAPYARTATLQTIGSATEQSFWLVAFNLSAGTGEPAAIAAIGPFPTSSSTATPVTLPSSQFPLVAALPAGPIALRAFTTTSPTSSTTFDPTKIVRSTQPVATTLPPRSAISKTLLFP